MKVEFVKILNEKNFILSDQEIRAIELPDFLTRLDFVMNIHPKAQYDFDLNLIFPALFWYLENFNLIFPTLFDW